MSEDPDVHANDIFPFARRVVPIAIVAAGLFALTMAAIVVGLSRKPPYDVLFAGLSPDAVASIVAKLRTDDVPYDVTTEAGRATIRIPADQIASERIRIVSTNASADAPGGTPHDGTEPRPRPSASPLATHAR